jgi:hypothetical protein
MQAVPGEGEQTTEGLVQQNTYAMQGFGVAIYV